MPKNKSKHRLEPLRKSGLGKKIFGSRPSKRKRASRPPGLGSRTLRSLRSATGALEDRLRGVQRREAGKKAARTRRDKARKRSIAGRKGAFTRAQRKQH